jgi:RNA polymerase sigma factor (sigma-70 family)
MMNETELLRAFKEERSEEAFAQLVRRYAGLVYSTARRRLNDAALAEDITQLVFIRFAKSPPEVSTPAALAGWLHRTTLHVAIDTWRSESRRRNREQQASAMQPVTNESTVWDEISPNLDEALNQLQDQDRETILLRFLSQKTMRELGLALGISEDAAKMRVSRALDRLRTQLGTRAAACTGVMLGTVLAEKSAPAAPAQLVTKLAAMKLPVLAKTAATGGGLAALLRAPGFRFAAGALALAVAAVVALNLPRPKDPAPAPAAATDKEPSTLRQSPVIPRPHSAQPAMAASLPPTRPVKTWFHVRDAETGAGLANAQIHFAYFGVGGVGEGHDTVTDARGDVPITEPDAPTRTGPNVFVTAEGYVPKSVGFRGTPPAEYTISLPPAMTIGGSVIDEDGLSVSGVEIRIQGPGDAPGQIENVDFQRGTITNRTDGTWSCNFVPREYTNTIQLGLKKAGYASTTVVVPVPKVNLAGLTLVIERGFTVTGRITDEENRPIAKAMVTTLSGQPANRMSVSTDGNGDFILAGIPGEAASSHEAPVTTNNGAVIIRGLIPESTPQVNLAITAAGFAPVLRTLTFANAHNNLEITLAPGRVFRGHVRDEAGNPISNAVVQTDWDNNGIRAIPWTTRTDAGGYFEWNSAPEQPVLFWFEADGYHWQRDVSLVADGSDHPVILKRKTP